MSTPSLPSCPFPLGVVGVCALLAAAGGCEGEGGREATSRGVTVDTLADGRVRVVNEGPAWGEGGGWWAVEELRIGTLEGEGPDQFGQIAALTTDPDGRIYVLDFMAQEIRVFDEDGSWSHTIGSRGEGPGELMRAAGLNWGPDGNLWVWDPGGRFSIFTPDGDFVDSRPRRIAGVVYPWRGEFDLDGALVDWGIDYPDVDLTAGQDPTRIVYYPTRFSGDFSEGDTLPPLSFDFEMTTGGERMVFGEGLTSYQDRAGAIWFAYNKSFRVWRRTLRGDTTLEFSIDATPTPVRQADIDSVTALYAEQGRPQAAPAADAFAPTKPMIRRIFGDAAGHVYVLSERDGLPLGTFVDVFTDGGRHLGQVGLPAPVNFPYPPPHATGSHLYYVTADDFDVEYVVRVRLEKRAANGGPGGPE